MRKPHPIFIAGICLASCSAPQAGNGLFVPADSSGQAAVAVAENHIPWVDEAIMSYISRSDNAIMTQVRRLSQDESWIIDRNELRDSSDYLVVHIGHDEAEPDGSNPRFATDGWLYLDTTRKRIYEYDLPNDSLVFWR